MKTDTGFSGAVGLSKPGRGVPRNQKTRCTERKRLPRYMQVPGDKTFRDVTQGKDKKHRKGRRKALKISSHKKKKGGFKKKSDRMLREKGEVNI